MKMVRISGVKQEKKSEITIIMGANHDFIRRYSDMDFEFSKYGWDFLAEFEFEY